MTVTAADLNPQVIDHHEQHTYCVRQTVTMGPGFVEAMQHGMDTLANTLIGADIEQPGPNASHYPQGIEGEFVLETSVIRTGAHEPADPIGEVVPSVLPAGRVATGTLVGGFELLGEAWGALMAWIESEGLTPAGGFWEVYSPLGVDTPTTKLFARIN